MMLVLNDKNDRLHLGISWKTLTFKGYNDIIFMLHGEVYLSF